jgi:hypothetical protein
MKETIKIVTKMIKKPNFIKDNKIIVIGSILGEIHELKSLIGNLEYWLSKNLIYEKYILVFLGNYVNKGVYTKQTIDFLLELSDSRKPNTTFFLMGKNELYLGHFLGLWNNTENKEKFQNTWKNSTNDENLWKVLFFI